MPTYDYECRRCGHTFEEFQAITARPRSRCPKCRGKVERLITAGAGILFKGSGFYVTDSRKARNSAASCHSSSGKSESGASESGKTTTAETKSAKAKSQDNAKKN